MFYRQTYVLVVETWKIHTKLCHNPVHYHPWILDVINSTPCVLDIIFSFIAKLIRQDSVLVIVNLNKAFDCVDWKTWRCCAKNRFCLLWNWTRHLIMWIGNLEDTVLGVDLVSYELNKRFDSSHWDSWRYLSLWVSCLVSTTSTM